MHDTNLPSSLCHWNCRLKVLQPLLNCKLSRRRVAAWAAERRVARATKMHALIGFWKKLVLSNMSFQDLSGTVVTGVNAGDLLHIILR